MKTMPRILLVLFTLSVVTLMLIARCGLNIDHYFRQQAEEAAAAAAAAGGADVLPANRARRAGVNNKSSANTLSAAVEHEKLMVLTKRYNRETTKLRKQIRFLEAALKTAFLKTKNLTLQISAAESNNKNNNNNDDDDDDDDNGEIKNKNEQGANSKDETEGKKNIPTESKVQTLDVNNSFNYTRFFLEQIRAAEILHGVPLKSEYELIPFNRFSATRIFLVEPGLGKRVVEKPIGFKKKDLSEVIQFSVDQLNENRKGMGQYGAENFAEGIYRIDPTSGSHYELYFHDIDRPGMKNYYSKLSVIRPFGPIQLITKNWVNTNKEWINLILPLSGRTETFRLFLDRFVRTCVLQDKRVFLTVVYFGKEGLSTVKDMLSGMAHSYKFKYIKLISLKEKFSRGQGLQVGALNWRNSNVLMFFCDVDIVFGVDFLERCRLNATPDKRVYYPIVFSLYNPNVVYSLHDMLIPPEKDQLVISRDTGFWRDFGYGMTCQYKSDFLTIRGFDEQITGWGGEDVLLYQKYVRSKYLVIRATDPGIFHLYHGKTCDPSLTPKQYRSCIQSKALNEASHAQLGLLAFKDEIDIHQGYKRLSSR
ncbi:chondroitin sulfate N-acetylgalactosaminyltransferase 1 [Octopus sinensis]|uniref:Hexosyltransferase n=1 Tax=Octopus sinensis TaxID=2607531 RepID=A0A6P7TJT1_9MOLL|nr:chondroitin sulfate N-acetylgalactosaminyltransferase 1 [Octopus sinensis]